MGVIRKVPEFVKDKLRTIHGAAINFNEPVEMVKYGPPATTFPDAPAAGYNHAVLMKIGAYAARLLINREDIAAHWAAICDNRQLARKMVVKKTTIANTHDLLDDFNEFTQLGLETFEVVSKPIADGTYTEFEFEVTPKCYWYTGKLTVPLHTPVMIVGGKVQVQIPVSPQLHQLATPLPTAASRYPGSLLTYKLNYTAVDVLMSIEAAPMGWTISGNGITQTQATALITALKTVDSQRWLWETTPNPLNLYNASIAYNGPVEGFVDRINGTYGAMRENHYGHIIRKLNKPRQDKKYVLVIIPDPAYCTNLLAEPIFIHYGGDRLSTVTRPPLHFWPLRINRLNYGADPSRPSWTNRGVLNSHGNECRGSFLLNNGGGYGAAAAAGKSTIGVDLPVDKDFTFSFDIAHQHFTQVSTIVAFQDIKNPSNRANAIVLSGPNANPMIGTAANIRSDAFYRDIIVWPNWTTITVTRQGDVYLIYANGEVVGYNPSQPGGISVINCIAIDAASHPFSIRDVRYYDYALDAQQVIASSLGRLDPVVQPQDTVLPTPKHNWPLNGDPTAVDDKAGVPLNPVFNYVTRAEMTDGTKLAVNGTTGGSPLGVDLPTNVDFTISYDVAFYKPPSGYDQLGYLLSGNGSHAISFYGTSPELAGSTVGDVFAVNDASMSTRTDMLMRQQLVKRRNILSLYVNGRYIRSQYWTDATTTVWNKFGGAATLSSYLGFRKLRYYDVALNESQLKADCFK